MFEQELELEKKEGSSFGPLIIIFLLVALLVGGIGFVVFQNKQVLKAEDASKVIAEQLKDKGPATVEFRTGNLKYGYSDNASDPQYKLLEKAGLLKVGKIKDYASLVELTSEGKKTVSMFPEFKENKDKDGNVAYVLPLAERKLSSIDTITKITPSKFQVQYSWTWAPNDIGNLFDINGKMVQGMSSYERAVLIDKHGANYYHGAPTKGSAIVVKTAKGWQIGTAE